MDKEVDNLLDKSPRPLPWALTMLVLVVVAVAWHSVFVGILAGISIGAYFGNYKGRFVVLKAWQKQMQADYRKEIAKLEAEYLYHQQTHGLSPRTRP